MNTRIYKVNTPNGSRLVRAVNKTQAIGFIARACLDAALATQDDLIALLADGVQVEAVNTEDDSDSAQVAA